MVQNEIVLTNQNPTPIEKELYRVAGFYKAREDENSVKYVVCYTDRTINRSVFPTELHMDLADIDFETSLHFSHLAEILEIRGYIDMQIFDLIRQRVNELGWKTLS